MFTLNAVTIVPSANCWQKGVPEKGFTPPTVMEHVVPAVPLKPEPATFTRVPMDPEVGDRTIVGTTLKLAEAESPRGPYTVMLYPKGVVHTDPVPTLKFAVRTPLLVTVHAGSPIVSIYNTPLPPPVGFVAVIVHPPGPPGLNPLPVAVTSVATCEPAAGEPLLGVSVSPAVTVNTADA